MWGPRCPASFGESGHAPSHRSAGEATGNTICRIPGGVPSTMFIFIRFFQKPIEVLAVLGLLDYDSTSHINLYVHQFLINLLLLYPRLNTENQWSSPRIKYGKLICTCLHDCYIYPESKCVKNTKSKSSAAYSQITLALSPLTNITVVINYYNYRLLQLLHHTMSFVTVQVDSKTRQCSLLVCMHVCVCACVCVRVHVCVATCPPPPPPPPRWQWREPNPSSAPRCGAEGARAPAPRSGTRAPSSR